MISGALETELNRTQSLDVAPEPKIAILGAGMSQHLEKYVGRIVRLNQSAFRQLSKSGQRGVNPPDNYFVVADSRRQMRQLICYGANLRIVVDVADVFLV